MMSIVKPKVIISTFPYEQAAFFQCIGGDEPVQSVYYNMAKWIQKEGLGYESRMIAGFDYPNQVWMPPPYGCVGLYFIEESEVVDGKYRNVHVQKFDTHGEYATLNVNCHISEAWKLMFEFRDEGKYAFDTDNGRQYFEQHIFGNAAFTHDERLTFNIWMPIKRI